MSYWKIRLHWVLFGCANASILNDEATLVKRVPADPACVTPARRGWYDARAVVMWVSVANAAESYRTLPDVSAVSDLEVLFESIKLNNDLLSRTSSIPMIQLLLVIVDWRPASVPHVPGLSGDK